jgi:hypothetical protein
MHFFYLGKFGSPDARNKQDIQDQENIKICTYNIINGLNGWLTFALKTMKSMGIILGILTETKLVNDIYPTNAHRYTITATSAKNHHQGGVALFYKTETKSFTLEGTCQFGPNIIRTTLTTGLRRWTVIGIYIPLSETDGTTLNHLQLAYNHANNDKVKLLGDINVNLDYMTNSNQRQDETAALISSMGLHDLRHHFRFKDNLKWTWRQLRNDMNITSVCDYIFTTNIKDFKNIKLKTPVDFDSDHQMVLATLRINQQQHKCYLRKRTMNPVPLFVEDNNNPAEMLFKEIMAIKQGQQPKANQQQLQHDKIDWISDQTYNLFCRKAMARRRRQNILARQLGRQVRRSLNDDHQAQIDKVANAAQMHLAQNNPRQAYQFL